MVAEETAKFLAMPPAGREAALDAAFANRKPRPGLQEEIDLVDAMGLEELQAALHRRFLDDDDLRSSPDFLRGAIKSHLKTKTLEMLRLGYNPAKGDGAKELELYKGAGNA